MNPGENGLHSCPQLGIAYDQDSACPKGQAATIPTQTITLNLCAPESSKALRLRPVQSDSTQRPRKEMRDLSALCGPPGWGHKSLWFWPSLSSWASPGRQSALQKNPEKTRREGWILGCRRRRNDRNQVSQFAN